jgi:hypothetical protein
MSTTPHSMGAPTLGGPKHTLVEGAPLGPPNSGAPLGLPPLTRLARGLAVARGKATR